MADRGSEPPRFLTMSLLNTGLTATAALKILGIAFAVGLDVLALSIAIGIMQSAWGRACASPLHLLSQK
jgi:hypothetical protein